MGAKGSTPSLAPIIPKDLSHVRTNLPVRFQSAIFRRDRVWFRAAMTAKGLKLELPLVQEDGASCERISSPSAQPSKEWEMARPREHDGVVYQRPNTRILWMCYFD